MNAGIEAYRDAVGKLQGHLSEIEMEMMEKELKEVSDAKLGHHFRAYNLAAKRPLEN